MDKKTIEELNEKLIKEKEDLEKILNDFATKDAGSPGGWRSNMPEYNQGGANLEEESDEVEAYQNLLSQEASLENRREEVNKALEKIKNGEYGICENCKKDIEIERLQTYPAAKTCQKCK
jgi:RNA polymerase-binding transcription factor DksA